MKLVETGPVGREAKVSASAKSRAGETGTVAGISRDRLYIQFQDGKSEWIWNKEIVGLRDKHHSDANK